MTLLDDMKLAVRIKSDGYDDELNMLIAAAKSDMLRCGVRPELVNPPAGGEVAPLVRMAVYCYCKAHYGYDNDEASRFGASYRQTVIDLLNSDANVAATPSASGRREDWEDGSE